MSEQIVFHDSFDSFEADPTSRVFEVFPPMFHDKRGYFCEVSKEGSNKLEDDMKWFNNLKWVKQVNRSCSKGKTIRGMHAQKGKYCQAKLVQALTSKVYDFITDARPNSRTFGVTQIFVLDPEKQNQLFVPKGFLHGFATTSDDPAIFEYMCDQVFDKPSEVGVNPMSVIPKLVEELENIAKEHNEIAKKYRDLFDLLKNKDDLLLSDKDLAAQDYETWMNKTEEDYLQIRKLWYKE